MDYSVFLNSVFYITGLYYSCRMFLLYHAGSKVFCMCKNSFYSMIPCERAIKMCVVIPECFQLVPFEIKLNHLGYRLKRSGITSHILIATY